MYQLKCAVSVRMSDADNQELLDALKEQGITALEIAATDICAAPLEEQEVYLAKTEKWLDYFKEQGFILHSFHMNFGPYYCLFNFDDKERAEAVERTLSLTKRVAQYGFKYVVTHTNGWDFPEGGDAGAYIGCRLCRKPQKTTRTLGLALIPQAGVAIGLSELAARTIGGVTGTVIQTVIMSSSILYELIGPAMAKLALTLSGAIPKTGDSVSGEVNFVEEQPLKNEREVLIERMREIQAEIDRNNYARSEEERAFTEAAENDETEEYVLNGEKNRKFINRR